MQFLRAGSQGPDVERVQQALNRRMLPPNNRFTSPPLAALVEDGRYGPKTQAMVREFQRLNQITVDGIVGPDTSYLLFPYIQFTAGLAGQGRIRGRLGQSDLVLPPRPPLRPPTFAVKRRNLTAAPSTAGDADPPEAEGLKFDLEVGIGIKREFTPWFVLKPQNPPEGAVSSSTLSVGATVLRLKGFEFGGELEFSKTLEGKGDTWTWEASVQGQYTEFKTADGVASFSPIAELSVKRGLVLGAGIGGEASVAIIKDRLELTVGGKVSGEWDPHEGNVKVGGEVTTGLKLKWDLVRFFGK
jgi:peptidoglycan hydrolase-like protein with peptidoglycan-binding domain